MTHNEESPLERDGDYAIQINEDTLDLAVEKHIRPAIEQRHVLDPDAPEGYHHNKVLPTARPLMRLEALQQDCVSAVQRALQANVNLLSQYEFMRAAAFLKQADPWEATEHFVDLVHGAEPLLTRINRFLEYAGQGVGANPNDVGFNSTVISYLFAVSDPQSYAFCKPLVYKEAAVALLGPDQLEKDKVKRLLHANAFYKAALKLFVDKYQLPFTDLFHTHIAFYLLRNKHLGFPGWNELRGERDEKRKSQPKQECGPAVLNRIYFGPPGTGKTFQAMRTAVEICEGSVPDDDRTVASRYRALQEEGRIGFVTFHQSYGYEDFVEGIRPVIDSIANEETRPNAISYECRPGVFRKMCDLAVSTVDSLRAGHAADLDRATIWKMSLGDTQNESEDAVYDECIRDGKLLLGYGWDLDFSDCSTKRAVDQKLAGIPGGKEVSSYAGAAVDMFRNKMQTGDYVIVSYGNRRFRAIGRIVGDYQYEPEGIRHQARSVEWLFVKDDGVPVERIMNKVFSQMTVYRLKQTVIKLDALNDLLNPELQSIPRPHVLVIDEINRGNIAKILGELITLLEPDKRLGEKNELRVQLPYSGDEFGIPSNLYVIGTMNTADRSIAFLDTALRRRFVFEEFMPDPEVISKVRGNSTNLNGVELMDLLEVLNERIEVSYDRDHQIGHSYFLAIESLDDLRACFRNKVIPLLQEYFYDDWSRICAVLGCPFDPDEVVQDDSNPYPLIRVRKVREEIMAGNGYEDLETPRRFMINPDFLSASEEELVSFFSNSFALE